VDAKLEALRTSALRVRDLVLDHANGPSCLAAYLSTAAELLEGRVDAVVANWVHWETWSTLVIALSHFLMLEVKLEQLGSRHTMALMEDQLEALWALVRPDSDLLVSHILPLVARGPPNGVGGGVVVVVVYPIVL
jgi:hypothetical protein